MQRNLARFEAAAEDMRVGKLSGAVGTFGHLKPEHEERICERLGLKPAPVATQVSSATGTRRISGRWRSLAARSTRSPSNPPPAAHRGARGTGVLQRKAEGLLLDAAQEEPDYVGADQRPRARSAFELAGGAGEYCPWHERDISHSSVERVIFPDSTILADYLLAKIRTLSIACLSIRSA